MALFGPKKVNPILINIQSFEYCEYIIICWLWRLFVTPNIFFILISVFLGLIFTKNNFIIKSKSRLFLDFCLLRELLHHTEHLFGLELLWVDLSHCCLFVLENYILLCQRAIYFTIGIRTNLLFNPSRST